MSLSWLADAGAFIFDKVFGDDDGKGQMPNAAEAQMAAAQKALASAAIFDKAKVGPKTSRFESSQAKLFMMPGFAEKFEELMELMTTDDLAKRQLAFALQEYRPGMTSTSKIGVERTSSPAARGPTIRI